MIVKTFTDLHVWQKAMDLVEEVYRLARTLPPEERFGLAARLRKSAVSVPANIAEGQGRKSSSEFRYHLSIALGSLRELETEFMIAGRLAYITRSDLEILQGRTGEVGRLLHGLYRALPTRRSTTD